ncbi:Small GTPase superfamily [Carpediemonas membranifera]|uniref:Small GTPase superfamily n=1 Tax=Carpediemonas membranifera TaxID=201153 RepID=A0A8J6E4S6_9EUKA|nr:Small GTPase superfamily [Carpediemonas membranifera]|eukprot:KAG9394882.1 Small GTPase superfamily [Carpediemonas membranifera]
MGHSYLFKFILCGDTGVGKSSIFLRFAEDRFHFIHEVTIQGDLRSKVVDVDGKMTKLQVWDTAGQEQFRSMARNYFRSAVGVLVVYDVTRRESFQSIDAWVADVVEQSTARQNTPIIIIANKIDCVSQRVVTQEEGQRYASSKGYLYAEISARTRENVNESFVELARRVYERMASGLLSPDSEGSGIRLTDGLDASGSDGCSC